MDINALVVFASVVENKSFTKAADKLGIEKSTVSSKISGLEKHLGARLLYRNTRCMALTESGEIYFQYCREIINNAIEAEEYVKSFQAEPQGQLRISITNGIARYLLKDVFSDFLARYENIDLKVRVTSPIQNIDVAAGEVDIAILPGKVPPVQTGTSSQQIGEFKWGFFASEEYIAEHGPISTIEELEQHPIIHFINPRAFNYQLHLRKNNKDFLPRYRNRITIYDIGSCMDAVEMGLGVGIMPSGSDRKEIKSRRFVEVLTDYKLPSGGTYAVYPTRRFRALKIQAFLEFIKQRRRNIRSGKLREDSIQKRK